MNSAVAQATAQYDVYRTLLRKSLEIISGSGTLETWLADLAETISDSSYSPEDKLEANAMIVGVLSIMLETIQGAEA